jgi:hypothetical protein
MLIQCLATIGALYLISLFVAVAVAAVYLTLQYLNHQSGVPGPSLPPTVDLHSLSLGQSGCNPIEPLHLVLVLSVSATFIFITGLLSASLVTRQASYRCFSRSVNNPEQPGPPSYGAC